MVVLHTNRRASYVSLNKHLNTRIFAVVSLPFGLRVGNYIYVTFSSFLSSSSAFFSSFLWSLSPIFKMFSFKFVSSLSKPFSLPSPLASLIHRSFATSQNVTTNVTVFRTVEEIRNWRRSALLQGKTVGMVPTMGALHRGHLNLGMSFKITFVFPSLFHVISQLSWHGSYGSADHLTLRGGPHYNVSQLFCGI